MNPKTRFKKDDGSSYPDWRTVVLSDIVGNITTGKVDANAMKENGEYRFYTCAKDYYLIDKYAFDDEAILISGNGANVGYIHYYNGKFNAYQRTYVLTDFQCNVFFLKYILQKNLKGRIDKEASKGNTPYITLSTLTGFQFFIPHPEEQQKIADFFTALDEKITNLDTQLSTMKDYKKTMLQQIFSQSLRFTKDDGGDYPDWESLQLSEVAERVTRKNTGNVSNNVLTISARHGLINQEEFFNKQIASKNNEHYILLHKGEFAYNKSYSSGYPVGVVKRLDKYDMGIVSNLYIFFKIDENKINSDFLVQYYETNYWHSSISQIAQEGARNHGLLNVKINEFFKTQHYFPTDIEEQQKIADFLTTIDDKINNITQQLAQAKDYKKAMLGEVIG